MLAYTYNEDYKLRQPWLIYVSLGNNILVLTNALFEAHFKYHDLIGTYVCIFGLYKHSYMSVLVLNIW